MGCHQKFIDCLGYHDPCECFSGRLELYDFGIVWHLNNDLNGLYCGATGDGGPFY